MWQFSQIFVDFFFHWFGVLSGVCVTFTPMSASVLPCNQVMTLYVTSLPQGISASKANTGLMSAIHCIWVQSRHVSIHTHTFNRSILPITAPYSPGAHNETQCLPQWEVCALLLDHSHSSETKIDIALLPCSFS